tara:strand:+ start:1015 stop:1215 length:201 start_codon:yes stop_codon:yes gene_type:complete
MSKEKSKDLSAVAWLNLVLGIYNIYLFSIGNLMFNLVIGTLNVGVWAFFRKPETILLFSRKKSNEK